MLKYNCNGKYVFSNNLEVQYATCHNAEAARLITVLLNKDVRKKIDIKARNHHENIMDGVKEKRS